MDYTDEDVRTLVEGIVGHRIPEVEWVAYKALRVIAGQMDAEDVEGAARSILKAEQAVGELKSKGEGRQPAPEGAPDERIPAFAFITISNAARDSEVVRWRSTYLPDGLLRPEQLEAFISGYRDEGRRRHAFPVVIVYVPSREPDVQEATLDDIQVIEVRESPVFAELAEVGKRLERRFWWPEIWSIHFVLTGIVPSPRQVVSRSIGRSFGPPIIVLEIDPRTSSGQVAARYDAERQSLVNRGQLRNASARSRPLGERAGHLAVFVSGRMGEPWGDLRREWNTKFPAWPSNDDRTFASEARRAWERVTGEAFGSPLRP